MKKPYSTKPRSLKEELDWLDPDQELDEDDRLPEEFRPASPTLRESLSRGFRSTLAVIICLVIPVLWYFNWDFSAFADKTSETVTGFFDESGSTVAPAPEAPEIAELPEVPVPPVSGALDMSITEYLAELNRLGYLEKISSPGVTALYENGVPVEYLTELNEAGFLDELSFPAVIAFYENSVPAGYLAQLEQAGYLDELSFPAVIAYFENEVSIEYLNRLNDAGFLDELSFPA
ncbi:MAG: hypothetical protein R3211_10935, partial [Balneolaceae bacterium]|nr:hypothetical protein [Balneolaceae bacterium]